MKKCILFFIFLCIGCNKNIYLNCNYTDINSIYGIKKYNDTLVFKENKLISFKREISFNLYNDMEKNIKNVYKNMKNESITFKKYIGGKYNINKSSNNITTTNKVNKLKNENLNYIGIDINSDYNNIKNDYKNIGFSCK